jgi:hypothetical protein
MRFSLWQKRNKLTYKKEQAKGRVKGTNQGENEEIDETVRL